MPELAPIPPAVRNHIGELTGELGILQHAVGASPDPAHPYCTDDVARALRVDILHARELGWSAVGRSVAMGVHFLEDAFDPTLRRFRNLRRVDGTWLERDMSEDAHARALLGLAEARVRVPDRDLRATAARLIEAALPAVDGFRHPRALAGASLAGAILARGGRDRNHVTARALAELLWAQITPPGGDMDAHSGFAEGQAGAGAGPTSGRTGRAPAELSWPWPEAVLTYENGIVPQALIVAGQTLARPELLVHGLRLLDWLLDVETAPEGHLSIVGNDGWYPRGGPRARWDQQPIEATSVLLAAEAAADATGAARYRDAMERCYGWYLGQNDAGVPVAIPGRGSCHDGLMATGTNDNQGAESTLMWLLAVEHMRRARRADLSRAPRREAVAAGARS